MGGKNESRSTNTKATAVNRNDDTIYFETTREDPLSPPPYNNRNSTIPKICPPILEAWSDHRYFFLSGALQALHGKIGHNVPKFVAHLANFIDGVFT